MVEFSSFTGSDIKCYIRLPKKPAVEWATLQTISISSARSIGQVRALGYSEPVGYTRGSRTYAGTLVFAVIDRDVLMDIGTHPLVQEFAPRRQAVSNVDPINADTLPPFDIIIIGTNEYGPAISQIVESVVLTNWGVTYSVDDLMTESTYTYICRSVRPIIRTSSTKPVKEEAGKSALDILDTRGVYF